MTKSRYPYRYETHMHTSEGSHCARESAREQIEFYAQRGYTGVFVTDHFWGNGSCRVDKELPFEEQVEQYFSFAEAAKKQGEKYGIDVFCGIEYSYRHTDFLIYGLAPEIIKAHPEIPDMKPHEFTRLARESGALVIQAHPFRLNSCSTIIRLFQREVDGFEVVNGANDEHQNKMAEIFRKEYKLLKFAGSDNHGISKGKTHFLAGVDTTRRVKDEQDFVKIIKNGKYRIFGEEL